MSVDEILKTGEERKEERAAYTSAISVCVAAGCAASGSEQVKSALADEVKNRGMEKECCVRGTGCLGLCASGPLVTVAADGKETLYGNVTCDHIAEIASSTHGAPVERIMLSNDIPFFSRQERIVMENAGVIDPERLDDYLSVDGYGALITCVSELSPAEVVAEILKSGLRGRGGGGYPTGLKWSTVMKASSMQKYVICNADEGDPGAFMDRSVLESDPHRILEGMAIAGYAVGASVGYVYVRAEYPLAVKRLKNAIKQAEKEGLLGNKICGTQFSFSIEVRLGAGAFVCGEETALIASIEGKRGSPRPRPPYPAENGLWGKPTLINNVETFANIPAIMRKGGAWFASIGTERSKGTKVFALAGAVVNTGLIEVPMGISLREIVYDIGGGIPDGGTLKAIQTGGPSGGCIPPQYLDMPVDYESLREAGSIMGSGGMIIMDQKSCMVDVAAYFMEFCKTESCGKCVPCRVGTAQMHDLLVKICEGRASMKDLTLLEELCELVSRTSLCGLGQTAPNPVISTLKFFKDEYHAHIVEKRCPAGVCSVGKKE